MRIGYVPVVFATVMMCTACSGSVLSGEEVDPPESPEGDGGIPFSACKRVDLVFSIDASATMREELTALSQDVFPAFATALRNVGGGLEDYRVGVMDACALQANFHTRGKTAEDCGFQSGEAWMDSNSTALNEEFACVADVYTADFNTEANPCTGQEDDEQPASTAAAALSSPFIDGPNAGFLREDALLVVVALTDEDEDPRPIKEKTPEEIYNELVAAKGDVGRMVFLGIAGAQDCIGTYGEADEARKLKAVTDLFIEQERGVFWDLCGGALEDGLSEAMAVIEATCVEIN